MTNPVPSKQTLRSLYDLYSNDIYRYAYLTLRNADQARDVVQDVYLKAYCSLDSFRNTSSQKTWIMAIARNHIFDILRKKRTERKHFTGYDIPEIIDDSSSLDTVIEIQLAKNSLSKR